MLDPVAVWAREDMVGRWVMGCPAFCMGAEKAVSRGWFFSYALKEVREP